LLRAERGTSGAKGNAEIADKQKAKVYKQIIKQIPPSAVEILKICVIYLLINLKFIGNLKNEYD